MQGRRGSPRPLHGQPPLRGDNQPAPTDAQQVEGVDRRTGDHAQDVAQDEGKDGGEVLEVLPQGCWGLTSSTCPGEDCWPLRRRRSLHQRPEEPEERSRADASGASRGTNAGEMAPVHAGGAPHPARADTTTRVARACDAT